MKRIFICALLLCIFPFFETGILAQTGGQVRITGKVTDAPTGEVLPGVNILIEGTTSGTVTGLDGVYDIMTEKGKTLVFSFIGYNVQKVQVTDERTINIALEPNTTELQEVVVSSQAKGQIGARTEQINSNTIKNVVAPDRLQENPDANAAEAIGRLPGISLLRSGGEGTQLVVRGLEPRYTTVTLNGVQLPSTDGSNRSTNVNGISQYALQGVEVYKALTADMEANSPAGTVNLKLKEAPEKFKSSIMVQAGYNDLNSYWGNYKVAGEVSNRFLNNRLGVFVSANAERVNRSAQTLSAGYSNIDVTDKLYVSSINLNDYSRIKYRRSVMASVDYRLTPSTTLKAYGLYTYSKTDERSQAKTYGTTTPDNVGYTFSYNPNGYSDIFQTDLSGETKLKFLNMALDYGYSYSKGISKTPESRSWLFGFQKSSPDDISTTEHRSLPLDEILAMFTDDPDSLQNMKLNYINISRDNMYDKNSTFHLNINIPVKIGDFISGYVKFGGMYREKRRFRDVTSGNQPITTNQFGQAMLADSLPWIVRTTDGNITGIGLKDHPVNNFLKGDYHFGYYFDFNKMNQMTDMWSKISEYYYNQGPSVWMPMFGESGKIGYQQNVEDCMINDQDITEKYGAGYVMTELNLGKWLMVAPGVRYEKTTDHMKGFIALQPTLSDPIYAPIPGSDTSASRHDEYLLPMIHMRIKPVDFAYLHLAYTQTLSRPDFNAISPNTFYNTGYAPFTYHTTNPNLKCEFWTNYDAQLTFHSQKLGLLSISGFYKTVKDKIWNRSYKRIKGDPIISPFPDAALVNVSLWENHKYKIYLKGMEFEWQTSFYYLPRPFRYFTLYANYTYTQSETRYPYTDLRTVVPPTGRPYTVRVDSTTTGPMLNQPKHIVNLSLGFNQKGFNAWLSFQYNGKINTGKNYTLAALDSWKDNFVRWDLQLTQQLPVKKFQAELVANIANLSNFMEKQGDKGDNRPSYLESYGWTADLGIRFRF